MIDIEAFIKDVKESTRQDFKDFETAYKICFVEESAEVPKDVWDKL